MGGLRKKKPYKKFLFFGILSFILYYLLLAYQDFILEICSRGRWYALFPIATAFVFSLVHGNFTDAFWSVLGVEPKRRKEVK